MIDPHRVARGSRRCAGLVVAVLALVACTSSGSASGPASTLAPPTAEPTAAPSTSATPTPTLGGRLPEGFSSVIIQVTRPDGTTAEWCVLLAAAGRDQARGLMDVDTLGRYAGMIFPFGQPVQALFYMLRTRVPLSIAFFAQDGSFVSSTDMAPCPNDDDDPPCPRYGASSPYTDALEVPLGDLAKLGIGPGSHLRQLDAGC